MYKYLLSLLIFIFFRTIAIASVDIPCENCIIKVYFANWKGMRMKVSYAPLWKLLIDKKMSHADFRKSVHLSPNTLTKMKRDDEVALSILLRIANYFNCNVGDICDFVKEVRSEREL